MMAWISAPIVAPRAAQFAAGLTAVIALTTAAVLSLSLGAGAIAVSASLFLALFVLMWTAGAGAPPVSFGLANWTTLARAALACVLGGLAAAGEASGAVAWAVVITASLAGVLDLADGWLARRRAEESPFGARFDMEADALLILVLSVLALQAGKAGPWVLAIGLMRYTFVAAGHVWPTLARPLPPSRRRRAVCAVQMIALIICLAPIVSPPAATAVAATALAMLILSFATDVATLLRAAGGPS